MDVRSEHYPAQRLHPGGTAQFWLHVIEAARQAGTRAMELVEGATNDWGVIIKDKRFLHLPTTTPILTKEDTNSTTSSLPPTQCRITFNVGQEAISPLHSAETFVSILSPANQSLHLYLLQQSPLYQFYHLRIQPPQICLALRHYFFPFTTCTQPKI